MRRIFESNAERGNEANYDRASDPFYSDAPRGSGVSLDVLSHVNALHFADALKAGGGLGVGTEWGVKLSDTCVADTCDPTPIAVYVNGVPYDGDPAAVELTDRRVIVIAIGTPPAEIPSTADFSQA